MSTSISKMGGTAVAKTAANAVQHVNNMRVEATVAKLGIDELSDLFGYSEYKVHTTLVAAETLKETGAKVIELSAAEMNEYRQRRKDYLEQMRLLTEGAGMRVLQRVGSLPLP